MPREIKETDVMVGRIKPGGNEGLDLMVVATTPEASVGIDGDVVEIILEGSVCMGGVVAGKKLEGISKDISVSEKLIFVKGRVRGKGYNGGR